MKINNEKDIDKVLNEYTESVGKASDKSRDLGKFYAKKSEKQEHNRSKVKRLMPVCVATVLVCAVLVSVSIHLCRSRVFEYNSPLDSSIVASSSGNNGNGYDSISDFFDSISDWFNSLKGGKGNNSDGSNNTTTTDVISEEKKSEIIDAYYEDMKDKIENLKKEDITFEFFIEINGVYAVRIDVGWLYQCAPSKETVDGVEFNYPYGPVSSYGIKIYYEGEFYRLGEAFDSGIVDNAALRKIKAAYNKNAD